jgi:hypothetical protein
MTMAMTPLRLNPHATLRREQITARDFCVIVDDFLAAPASLVEYACSHPAEFSHPNIGYPGVQIRLNDDAMAEIYRFVRSKMSKEYAFLRGRIGIRSLLSMVTLPPERLSFMQRICHVDPHAGAGRAKYAALLYLFDDARLGGTSFYRLRDEQLVWQGVSLLRRDVAQGEEFMKQHFETLRGPPSYMTGSNDVAELIYTVPPRFNRFVFYSGDLPHTGAVEAPELLSDDPKRGRLTLNLFFSVMPIDSASRT